MAIHVDDSDAAAAALRRYRVGTTPTTIVTDAQGDVLETVEMGKSDVLELLAKPSAATLTR